MHNVSMSTSASQRPTTLVTLRWSALRLKQTMRQGIDTSRTIVAPLQPPPPLHTRKSPMAGKGEFHPTHVVTIATTIHKGGIAALISALRFSTQREDLGSSTITRCERLDNGALPSLPSYPTTRSGFGVVTPSAICSDPPPRGFNDL